MSELVNNARGRRKTRLEKLWAQQLLQRLAQEPYPADVLAEIRLAAQREQEREE